MPLGRLVPGSSSQLSTPTLDKTRSLYASRRSLAARVDISQENAEKSSLDDLSDMADRVLCAEGRRVGFGHALPLERDVGVTIRFRVGNDGNAPLVMEQIPSCIPTSQGRLPTSRDGGLRP